MMPMTTVYTRITVYHCKIIADLFLPMLWLLIMRVTTSVRRWEVARMCREREQNGLECRDGNFWYSALRGEDWFDYRREGPGHLVWREERGATPQGVVTFTHSCQCQEAANQRPWYQKLTNQRSHRILTRAHHDWAVHKNTRPTKSSDSPRLFGMMTKLFLLPAFLLAPLCSWVITLPIKTIILIAPKCPFTKVGVNCEAQN